MNLSQKDKSLLRDHKNVRGRIKNLRGITFKPYINALSRIRVQAVEGEGGLAQHYSAAPHPYFLHRSSAFGTVAREWRSATSVEQGAENDKYI